MTPEPCSRCGVPHDPARCNAHAKQTGVQCKRTPAIGQHVCVKHGGGAPQARAAAEERIARARAVGEVGALLAEAYEAVDGMTGIEHLEAGIKRAAAMAHAYEILIRELPERSRWDWDDHYSQEGSRQGRVDVTEEGLAGPNARGEVKLHVYEEGLHRWTKLHGELVRNAIVLGIEERKVALATEQVDRIGGAIVALVAGLGRDLDDPTVVPVVEAALRAIAGETGPGPAALGVTS